MCLSGDIKLSPTMQTMVVDFKTIFIFSLPIPKEKQLMCIYKKKVFYHFLVQSVLLWSS